MVGPTLSRVFTNSFIADKKKNEKKKEQQQQQETSESISLKACLTQANEYTDDSVSLDINFMRGPRPHS